MLTKAQSTCMCTSFNVIQGTKVSRGFSCSVFTAISCWSLFPSELLVQLFTDW